MRFAGGIGHHILRYVSDHLDLTVVSTRAALLQPLDEIMVHRPALSQQSRPDQ